MAQGLVARSISAIPCSNSCTFPPFLVSAASHRNFCPLAAAAAAAGIGGSFYLGYSWLPSFFVTHVGLSTMLTLWMVLVSMVIFTFVVPIAGILSDRGSLRPVSATIGICVVAAATSVPMFLAFQTKHLAACWILQIVSLCMTAYTMGILPVICSNIYPAGVRISGFNLGYNLGKLIDHDVHVLAILKCITQHNA